MSSSSSPTKRALADGEVEDQSATMRRPSLDLELMQESMSTMEKGFRQMQSNLEVRETQWGQMADICAAVSARQEETAAVANKLVSELAGAMGQIKDDQRVMHGNMEDRDSQWSQASNLCGKMAQQQENANLITDKLVQELSETMNQIRADQMSMQQTDNAV